MPITSQQPASIRPGDTVQIPGHKGQLLTAPQPAAPGTVQLHLQCIPCAQAHTVQVPGTRVVTVERARA